MPVINPAAATGCAHSNSEPLRSSALDPVEHLLESGKAVLCAQIQRHLSGMKRTFIANRPKVGFGP